MDQLQTAQPNYANQILELKKRIKILEDYSLNFTKEDQEILAKLF